MDSFRAELKKNLANAIALPLSHSYEAPITKSIEALLEPFGINENKLLSYAHYISKLLFFQTTSIYSSLRGHQNDDGAS